MKSTFTLLLATLLLATCWIPAQAQTSAPDNTCHIPGTLKSSTQPNMFTEEQEQWLGEIMDQELRSNFNIIEDREGFLQKLGDRLVAQLPPTEIKFHFAIIDAPELNSFGVAGGYIYIHRRMIAFTQNEDELAALLGHEIGHIVDHHVAIRMTSWWKQLGITSVSDKQDVIARWNLFEDKQGKIKERHERQIEDEEQLIADRLAIYAATRAGYDPMRYVDFADRLLQTKGKTGGFWSDFFGATTSESKRLREVIKNAEPIAKTCVTTRVADSAHFEQWKKNIMESGRVAAKEDVPGLLNKVRLQPELRSDVRHLEFSPDGKYLLAQDDSSVFVLAREPLASLFRIDALDAHDAKFSADSRSVLFYDKELRVEKWDVDSKKRSALYELAIPECFQSTLSPSGQYLACIDNELTLRIVDVRTNKVILTRERFYQLSSREYLPFVFALSNIEPFRLFDLKFSPDSRYFAIGHRNTFFAYDFVTSTEVHLPLKVQDMMVGTFAFISPTEIAGLEYVGDGAKLIRARFPSGDKIAEFKFQADGFLSSTESSNYLLVRPAGSYPLGLVDLKAQKIALAFKTPAFAVYDKFFAGEQNSGEIALLNSSDNKLAGKIQLPDSPLGRPKATTFSKDGKWLAVSGDSRGSMWKLDTGERVFFTHGFEGTLFDGDEIISEFDKHEPAPYRVFQLDAATKGTKLLYEVIPSTHKDHKTFQMEDLLVTVRPEKDQEEITNRIEFSDYLAILNRHSVVEVHDVKTNKLLWEKTIQERNPRLFYSNGVITLLRSRWGGVRAAAKDDPNLKSKLSMEDDNHDEYVVQAFDASTGNLLGSVVIPTTKFSFDATSAYTVHNLVFVGDSKNRTLVYSLKSGEQTGRFFGHVVAATHDGEKMLVENEDGVSDLYATATLKAEEHLTFPARITDADFTIDGTLLVLTADQTVYKVKPQMSTEGAVAK